MPCPSRKCNYRVENALFPGEQTPLNGANYLSFSHLWVSEKFQRTGWFTAAGGSNNTCWLPKSRQPWTKDSRTPTHHKSVSVDVVKVGAPRRANNFRAFCANNEVRTVHIEDCLCFTLEIFRSTSSISLTPFPLGTLHPTHFNRCLLTRYLRLIPTRSLAP